MEWTGFTDGDLFFIIPAIFLPGQLLITFTRLELYSSKSLPDGPGTNVPLELSGSTLDFGFDQKCRFFAFRTTLFLLDKADAKIWDI